MSTQKRVLRTKRRHAALLGLTAVLSTLSACAQIVGIEDTAVTRADGSAGADANSSGNARTAGSTQAGTSNAGRADGGSSPGGTTASAGTEAGGAAAGGGVMNQAGSAGNAGNAGNAASECPCSAPKPTCENGKCVVRGPTMAKTTSYYIDSTEISKAQYDVFLAAKGPDTSAQVAECSWNTSYAADGPAVDDPRPMVNVDWCDAAAYCAWADKRLCGAIGGGALPPADVNNATKGQWYLACAGASNDRYPYGGTTFKPDYCNEYSSGDMADIAEFDKCEGHYPGIFDLVGNAAEWIDSCDTDGGTDRSLDNCRLTGGSFVSADYTCQTYFDTYRRSDHRSAFGFRCCSK